MVKLNQSSFRRILLSRILLLSVPVLLIGEAVAFRKVRSSMLATSRQHLNVSAVRKSEQIVEQIATMQSKMLLASQSTALQSGSPTAIKQFLANFNLQFPINTIKCLQLTSFPEDKIIASTCNEGDSVLEANLRSQVQANLPPKLQSVEIKSVFTTLAPANKQLQLLLSTPVYNNALRQRYVLKMQAMLNSQRLQGIARESGLRSLADSTVIIAENGTIIAHPLTERVGGNISQEIYPQQWKKIIRNASQQENGFKNLFFTHKRVPLLASYRAIDSPITQELGQHWIVLAVTPQSTALMGLKEIKLILFLLTLSLLGASLFTALRLARELAEPLEQL